MTRRKTPVDGPTEEAEKIAPDDRGPAAVVTKVHIVDDDPISRMLLQRIVEAGGWRAEVHESAELFLAALRADGPGCVLLDMRMPGMNGLDCLREIKRRDSLLTIVMVTGYGEVEFAVEAMKGGALDFLEKPIAVRQVLEAVRVALDRSWAAYGERRARAGRERSLARLTPRERQVLDRIVRGEINKAVGKRLGISEKTVEVHRARVMSKLDAKSLADLIRIVRGEELSATDGAGSDGAAAVVLPLKAKAAPGKG
ncbi:MAG: response regulator [Pseudomonadota bacterium]